MDYYIFNLGMPYRQQDLTITFLMLACELRSVFKTNRLSYNLSG